jgi:hypothetical protein
MGKKTRAAFKRSDKADSRHMTWLKFNLHHSPEDPGSLIVSDLMGPFSNLGIDGSRYFVTYTDVFNRFCAVASLKKSE